MAKKKADTEAEATIGGWAIVKDDGCFLDRQACWTREASDAWLFHGDIDAQAYNALHCGGENLIKRV